MLAYPLCHSRCIRRAERDCWSTNPDRLPWSLTIGHLGVRCKRKERVYCSVLSCSSRLGSGRFENVISPQGRPCVSCAEPQVVMHPKHFVNINFPFRRTLSRRCGLDKPLTLWYCGKQDLENQVSSRCLCERRICLASAQEGSYAAMCSLHCSAHYVDRCFKWALSTLLEDRYKMNCQSATAFWPIP